MSQRGTYLSFSLVESSLKNETVSFVCYYDEAL